MDAGTKFTMKLTNGKTLEYGITGHNHDDLADGSCKAGITFEATNSVMGAQRMNATFTNVGGWEKSELRSRLNTGDLWSLMPSDFRSKVKSVTKKTDNKGDSNPGTSAGTPSATTDKVFLLSCTEVYGDLASDGSQYEYFKSKGVTKSTIPGLGPSQSLITGLAPCSRFSVTPLTPGTFAMSLTPVTGAAVLRRAVTQCSPLGASNPIGI